MPSMVESVRPLPDPSNEWTIGGSMPMLTMNRTTPERSLPTTILRRGSSGSRSDSRMLIKHIRQREAAMTNWHDCCRKRSREVAKNPFSGQHQALLGSQLVLISAGLMASVVSDSPPHNAAAVAEGVGQRVWRFDGHGSAACE
jgi:hypothetical protein